MKRNWEFHRWELGNLGIPWNFWETETRKSLGQGRIQGKIPTLGMWGRNRTQHPAGIQTSGIPWENLGRAIPGNLGMLWGDFFGNLRLPDPWENSAIPRDPLFLGILQGIVPEQSQVFIGIGVFIPIPAQEFPIFTAASSFWDSQIPEFCHHFGIPNSQSVPEFPNPGAVPGSWWLGLC